MSSEADTRGPTIREWACIHVPLNSKQLTVGQLRCLVVVLEVPSSDTSAYIQLIIEGKLTKLEQNHITYRLLYMKVHPWLC